MNSLRYRPDSFYLKDYYKAQFFFLNKKSMPYPIKVRRTRDERINISLKYPEKSILIPNRFLICEWIQMYVMLLESSKYSLSYKDL